VVVMCLFRVTSEESATMSFGPVLSDPVLKIAPNRLDWASCDTKDVSKLLRSSLRRALNLDLLTFLSFCRLAFHDETASIAVVGL